MSRLIPRGAVVAGLGKRFLAAVIDALPFLAIGALGAFAGRSASEPTVALVIVIGAGVLSLAFALYQWWAYAVRGAGLGAQAMGLRLVSLKDGEPIGWWRVFLRHVVFSAVMGTVIGGIALLIFLVIHERRQGWHDMAVSAVVVQPREAEARSGGAAPRKTAQASTVGLPPHLSSSFSPQPGTTATPNWDSFAPRGAQQGAPQGAPHGGVPAQPRTQLSAPDWLPGVQSEPVEPAPQQAPFQASAQWRPPAAKTPAPSPWQAPQPPKPVLPEPTPAESPKPPRAWIPLPTPTSVIEPSMKVRRRDFGEVEDNEGTRIANLPSTASRGGGEGWYLRLDDGREVELTVTVLLGRNPQKGPEDPEVHLVPASGDGRMISRTHVQIGTDPRGVYVVDRGSTNGTALVTQGGELEPCPSGTQVRVREGQQVSYGNRWFTVLRRPVIV
ncbi:RDD family protein [Tessaracoccus sp. ZS01]|uniref:RDD family protein n=1 Tax=Tessaracoccus sp. ZS01 TaxID=1906324 RepID=UPI0009F9DE57|nr:RDD family protein [Tessaracoccus sp. ZS01]MCG6568257.1 hypothetical protein [Tessaracoccus sp. ZS01]